MYQPSGTYTLREAVGSGGEWGAGSQPPLRNMGQGSQDIVYELLATNYKKMFTTMQAKHH